MIYSISETPDVRVRALFLGLNDLSDITFLPRHFWSADNFEQLVHESSASTICTLFRQSGLSSVKARKDTESIPTIHEKSFDWMAPIIFFSATLLTNDPNSISIACGVIGNYVTDLFRGRKKPESIKVELLIETTKSKTVKKFTYEGCPSELHTFAKIIEQVKDE